MNEEGIKELQETQEAEKSVDSEENTAAADAGTVTADTVELAQDASAVLEQPAETMEDYAKELEASYKEYDERRNQIYVEEESPDAEKWQELKQMQVERSVVKVKVKEIVKGGAIAFVDEIKAFIPASQLSLEYVEKLEDWVGKHIETYIITVEPEKKRLVLSARELLKERRDAERKEKLSSFKAGDIVEGTVESLKDYGAFVALTDGVTGLLHISQISNQRIKHPGVVLKEGQKVKVKILSVQENKISLSMKALEPEEKEEKVDFEYKSTDKVYTGLGDLLKNLKL